MPIRNSVESFWQRKVNDALQRGGNLLIPSFAIERTQELLLDLASLTNSGAISEAPIFLDSPLAIQATNVFAAHLADLEDVPHNSNPFHRRNIHFTATVDESKGDRPL